jgi:hypothetical protein
VTWVEIVPGDDVAQVARDLLSLADSPHQVRTSSDNGLTFFVTTDVADAYMALTAEISTAGPDQPAVPKRRGRARKDL